MGTIRSQHIRDAARDEPCTLQIAGVCIGNWETTVLAHLPDESKGMGTKADDLSACFACEACHSVIDGRTLYKFAVNDLDWYMRRAMVRTWRRLVDKGIITIKGHKP